MPELLKFDNTGAQATRQIGRIMLCGTHKYMDLRTAISDKIAALRGVDSAFMPDYRISHYQKATIKQDTANNRLRPKSAVTEFSNVFIAGDWTMQNYPCCMEVAVQSGKRAVKTALKSK